MDALLVVFGYVIFLMIVAFLGLYNLPSDYTVDTAYLNGFLTAQAILFGFWAVVVGREPKDKVQKWRRQNIIPESFFICFILFGCTTISIWFSALGKVPSLCALSISLIGFLMIAFFVALTLYYYTFKADDPEIVMYA